MICFFLAARIFSLDSFDNWVRVAIDEILSHLFFFPFGGRTGLFVDEGDEWEAGRRILLFLEGRRILLGNAVLFPREVDLVVGDVRDLLGTLGDELRHLPLPLFVADGPDAERWAAAELLCL